MEKISLCILKICNTEIPIVYINEKATYLHFPAEKQTSNDIVEFDHAFFSLMMKITNLGFVKFATETEIKKNPKPISCIRFDGKIFQHWVAFVESLSMAV